MSKGLFLLAFIKHCFSSNHFYNNLYQTDYLTDDYYCLADQLYQWINRSKRHFLRILIYMHWKKLSNILSKILSIDNSTSAFSPIKLCTILQQFMAISNESCLVQINKCNLFNFISSAPWVINKLKLKCIFITYGLND